MTRAASPTPATSAAPSGARRGGRRPGPVSTLTRDTILAAARGEFAAHGYDGTGVDVIAREARVNKAMIYYHFGSKAGLYHTMLRELFVRTGDRVRALVASRQSPEDKLDVVVEQLSAFLSGNPELPQIMMREIAEGARHLDPEMLRALSRLFRTVTSIVAKGQRDGAFAPADPLLVYFTLVGPLIVFVGGAPVRRAMSRLKAGGNWDCTPDALAAHMKRVMRSLLARAEPSRPPRRHRPVRRSSETEA